MKYPMDMIILPLLKSTVSSSDSPGVGDADLGRALTDMIDFEDVR